MSKRAAELESLAGSDAYVAQQPAESTPAPKASRSGLRRAFKYEGGKLMPLDSEAGLFERSASSSDECAATCEESAQAPCESAGKSASKSAREATSEGQGSAASSAKVKAPKSKAPAPKLKTKVKSKGDVALALPRTPAPPASGLQAEQHGLELRLHELRRLQQEHVEHAHEQVQDALRQIERSQQAGGAQSRRAVELARSELARAQRETFSEARSSVERAMREARDAQRQALDGARAAARAHQAQARVRVVTPHSAPALPPMAAVPAMPAMPSMPPMPATPRSGGQGRGQTDRERALEQRVAELEQRLAEMEGRSRAPEAADPHSGRFRVFSPDGQTEVRLWESAPGSHSFHFEHTNSDGADCNPTRTHVLQLGGDLAGLFVAPDPTDDVDWEEFDEEFAEMDEEFEEAFEDIGDEWEEALEDVSETIEAAGEQLDEAEEALDDEDDDDGDDGDDGDDDELKGELGTSTVVQRLPAGWSVAPLASMPGFSLKTDVRGALTASPLGASLPALTLARMTAPAIEVDLHEVVTQMRSEVEALRSTLRDLRQEVEARKGGSVR